MKSIFIQLPRALFEGAYAGLSSDGKLLYSLLLSRHSLSTKNNMSDSSGKIIVYFTVHEVCDKLRCSHDKATGIFRELERFGLIKRRKQGLGKPAIIYVKKIPDCKDSALQDTGTLQHEARKNGTHERSDSARNNINSSDTEANQFNLSVEYEDVENVMKALIDYDDLIIKYGAAIIDELVNIIADTFCACENTVKMGKRLIPIETVRVRLSKLKRDHIEYVLGKLDNNETVIRNIRSYILTALYYSIDTIEVDGLYGC